MYSHTTEKTPMYYKNGKSLPILNHITMYENPRVTICGGDLVINKRNVL